MEEKIRIIELNPGRKVWEMKIHDDRVSLSDLDSMHSSEVTESGIKLQGIAVHPHSDKNAKATRNQKSDRTSLRYPPQFHSSIGICYK